MSEPIGRTTPASRRFLRRRDVLRGAGAAALSLWAAPPPRAQAPPRIALPITLFAESATLFNAQFGGHFGGARAGADIELVPDSRAVLTGLREGRFTFGEVQALDLMRAAAQPGEPLLSIATYSRIPNYLFGFRRRLPEEPKRFPRSKIAISSEVVDADAYLSLYLARNEIDPALVNRVPANREQDALDLVLAKKVDGAIVSSGYNALIALAMRERGVSHEKVGTVSRFLDRMVAPFPGLCFAATRAAIEARPALAADFVRALLLSAREQLAMWDAKLAKDDADLDYTARLKRAPKPARTELHNYMVAGALVLAGLWRATGDRARPLWHDPNRWNDGAALLARARIADIGGPADRLHTNRFVDEAAR